MPTMITDACINCGACLHSCPNDGISRGEHKVVLDSTLCTECVGFYSSEQCAAVCPIGDVCIPDPDNVETEAVLFERAKRIHALSPKPPTLSSKTSHFRKSKTLRWWQRLIPSLAPSIRNLPEIEDA